MNPQKHWQNQYQQYQKQIQPWERKSIQISTWRIIVILGAVISAIVADQSGSSIGFALSFACLAIFVGLVIQHHKIKAQIKMLQAKINVSAKLVQRCDDTWRTEKQDLRQEIKTDNPIGDDLDLLGEHSLFQYLNFTKTMYGQARLGELLLDGEQERSTIKLRQEAISELLDKDEWWMQFAGCVEGFENHHHFQAVKTQSYPAFPKWFIWGSFTVSAVIMVLLVLGFFHVLPYGYAAVLILAHLIVGFVIRRRCSEELAAAVEYVAAFKGYEPLFSCIKQEDFQNELLRKLQQSATQAQMGMAGLRRVMDFIALRQNLFAIWIVGALFPIDVASVVCFHQWQNQYGHESTAWLKAVGEMEALISLSVLAKVKERWCFPEFCDAKELVLEVKEGTHPLIHEPKAVPNSMTLQGGTFLITGSNMSGKTTFLRTLGTLSVLSRAGAPVCAVKLRTSLLRVFTSIRIRDDVNAGISTFYAELLRIKTMIDFCDQNQPMLVLIDEIFTGTNSADRILCAKTIIHRLHRPNNITIVSTHDFELCDLDKDPAIMAQNYHFSESYQNDEICFDYRLRNGRATTTNALELLRMVGIEASDNE